MYFPAGIVIALEIISLLMMLRNEHTYDVHQMSHLIKNKYNGSEHDTYFVLPT